MNQGNFSRDEAHGRAAELRGKYVISWRGGANPGECLYYQDARFLGEPPRYWTKSLANARSWERLEDARLYAAVVTKDPVRVERVGDEPEPAVGEAEIEEYRVELGRELEGKYILATHGNPQHPRYFVGDRFGELYDRNWSLNAGCAKG